MSVRTETLATGLRVASDRMDSVETISVGAFVEVGTRDETPAINGVSHFLEHMAFKGTERRNAYAIAAEIEAVGGHLNAYTSREHTAYYAKVLRDDLPLAVDLLADILQHSVMDAAELERERAVIVQEIHQANDTPDDLVFDLFQETAYPDQPMGRPVLGTIERVEKMDRNGVLDYMRGNYSAPRIVVSAAGRVDHRRLVELVGNAFTDVPTHQETIRQPARYAGGACLQVRNLEQVQFLLGVDGIAFGDDAFYDLSVLSTLFGGGMSSRLFQEVREKRGLAYSIYSFMSCYADSGMFAIYAGTGADTAGELAPLLCDEMAKVCHDVTDEEVARGKAQLKSSLLMARESTSNRCEQMARQLAVYGRPIPIEELVGKLDAVDKASVEAVARRLFRGAPTLTALGPVADLDVFDDIAKRLN